MSEYTELHRFLSETYYEIDQDDRDFAEKVWDFARQHFSDQARPIQPSNETLAAKITEKAFDMIADGNDVGLVKKEVNRILSEAQPVQPAAEQQGKGE